MSQITRVEFDRLVQRVAELEASNDLMLLALSTRDEEADNNLTMKDVKVGDKVRFNDRARPKYIQGGTATVTSKRRTRVAIKLDQSYPRFTGIIVCPLTILEKV